MRTTIEAFNHMIGLMSSKLPEDLDGFFENDIDSMRVAVRTSLFVSNLLGLSPGELTHLLLDEGRREMVVDRLVVGAIIISQPHVSWLPPFKDPVVARALLVHEIKEALGLAPVAANKEPN